MCTHCHGSHSRLFGPMASLTFAQGLSRSYAHACIGICAHSNARMMQRCMLRAVSGTFTRVVLCIAQVHERAHTRAHTCTHACLPAHMRTRMLAQAHMHMYVHTAHMYTPTHTHPSSHTRTHSHTLTCIQVTLVLSSPYSAVESQGVVQLRVEISREGQYVSACDQPFLSRNPDRPILMQVHTIILNHTSLEVQLAHAAQRNVMQPMHAYTRTHKVWCEGIIGHWMGVLSSCSTGPHQHGRWHGACTHAHGGMVIYAYCRMMTAHIVLACINFVHM